MSWKRRVLALCVSLALTLVAGELACRLLFADRLAHRADERNLTYRHDERLGWFPVPGSRRGGSQPRWASATLTPAPGAALPPTAVPARRANSVAAVTSPGVAAIG